MLLLPRKKAQKEKGRDFRDLRKKERTAGIPRAHPKKLKNRRFVKAGIGKKGEENWHARPNRNTPSAEKEKKLENPVLTGSKKGDGLSSVPERRGANQNYRETEAKRKLAATPKRPRNIF